MKEKDIGSLEHTRWRCQYHVVFAPSCPPRWKSFAFCVEFRGRSIRVRADQNGASYELLRGEPITVLSYGKPVRLA